MLVDNRLIQIAYKKMKSSVYFDKTQLILRDKMVDYESQEDFDQCLERLTDSINDPKKRATLFQDILSHIRYHVFPKTLINEKTHIISNYYPKTTKVDGAQCFIDLDVEGHILGVLWLMLIGYKIDKGFFINSKGNRIRKNLYNEFSESVTFSPYLFEPYYQQYESWRDTALDTANSCLQSQQDVMILTLDFRQFYYSIDITKILMDQIADAYIEKETEDSDFLMSLNDFIFAVIEKYALLFQDQFEGRKILPIGFLPSNVLANYALKNFDNAVLDGWNPVYYGRYVDDILIVEKIEDKSDLFVHAEKNTLSKDMILHYYLEECATWKGYNGIPCKGNCTYSLFRSDTIGTGDEKKTEYTLRRDYNPTNHSDDKTKIRLHDDKVKVFYFKSGETDALISCFRKEIGRNKSEFRHLPEDEAVFQKDDYSAIYSLKNTDTVNKFRGITELSIDKYELSKMLGKTLRIAGMVSDPGEYQLFQHIKRIFNNRVIIENYTVWEKIIEVLVINESFSALNDFIKSISEAINTTSFSKEDGFFKNKILRESLKLHLIASISRAFALVWNNKINGCLREAFKDDELTVTEIINKRKEYCYTRMIDKSVIPVFIDLINLEKLFKGDYNLTRYSQTMSLCDEKINEYIYYPYLVNTYDILNMRCMQQLKKNKGIPKISRLYSDLQDKYICINYNPIGKVIPETERYIVTGKGKIKEKQLDYLLIRNEKRSKLRIGIANVKLDHSNFERVVKDNLNRSYKRYTELSRIVNMAIDEGVDLLVMPEAYLPMEWINTLARTCARNSLAVITGVEHVKVPAPEELKEGDYIYNLTAIILPFVEKEYPSKNAVIAYHLKNHYAPFEKMMINGYRLQEVEGDGYELYNWHGCFFSLFCCYELASVSDRALLQSYVDLLIAIEWNRDINYFSNIMESLSRDVHCYCVQVNSSEYGDSRITAPVSSERMDVVRTKGGINSTILVGDIDIRKLREFQIKEYPLQRQDGSFKPTPPGFNPNIVMEKIKGEEILSGFEKNDNNEGGVEK